MIDWVSALLRALSFVVLFQAAGGAVFLTLFGRQLPRSAIPIGRLAQVAAVTAVVLLLGQFCLEPARLAGEMAGLRDPQMQQLAWQSTSGLVVRWRLGGLLLVLAGLQISMRADTAHAWRRLCGLLGPAAAAAVLATFTLVGHTVDHPGRVALALVLVVHLSGVTFWFGAIWPLRQAVSLEAPVTAATLLEKFSRLAVWIVPGLLLAGSTLAVLLVSGIRVFAQPYGQLLLAKVAGFSILMGFAALNKWRLTPALRVNAATAVARLRRSLSMEYGVIAAVLAITAVMTGLYSPD
jgi:copper resistance protein D